MSQDNVEEMISILADYPEEMRNQILTDFLTENAFQHEDQRTQTMKEIVLAIAELDAEKRREFIMAWTNAVAEAPEESRRAILKARINAGNLVPLEVNREDMMQMIQTTLAWSEEKRKMFMVNLRMTFQELGMQEPWFLHPRAHYFADAKEETKKPWWKFW